MVETPCKRTIQGFYRFLIKGLLGFIWLFPKNGGPIFVSPRNKDHSILRFIVGHMKSRSTQGSQPLLHIEDQTPVGSPLLRPAPEQRGGPLG